MINSYTNILIGVNLLITDAYGPKNIHVSHRIPTIFELLDGISIARPNSNDVEKTLSFIGRGESIITNSSSIEKDRVENLKHSTGVSLSFQWREEGGLISDVPFTEFHREFLTPTSWDVDTHARNFNYSTDFKLYYESKILAYSNVTTIETQEVEVNVPQPNATNEQNAIIEHNIENHVKAEEPNDEFWLQSMKTLQTYDNVGTGSAHNVVLENHGKDEAIDVSFQYLDTEIFFLTMFITTVRVLYKYREKIWKEYQKVNALQSVIKDTTETDDESLLDSELNEEINHHDFETEASPLNSIPFFVNNDENLDLPMIGCGSDRNENVTLDKNQDFGLEIDEEKTSRNENRNDAHQDICSELLGSPERLRALRCISCTNYVKTLEKMNAEQRVCISSLEKQMKEQNISIMNLESHIESLNYEMMKARHKHQVEQERLHNAYEELKGEASKLTEWMKYQISGQSPERRAQIEKYKEESDLESLTLSERKRLKEEIEEERNLWMSELTDIQLSFSAKSAGERDSSDDSSTDSCLSMDSEEM
jgi:hypothetical protein